MDVKTAFLNRDLYEDVYMTQPVSFVMIGKEHMVYKLKKSNYGLKQASRQWYLKFDMIVTANGFKENVMQLINVYHEGQWEQFYISSVIC